MEYEIIGGVVEFYLNCEFKRLVIKNDDPEETINEYIRLIG